MKRFCTIVQSAYPEDIRIRKQVRYLVQEGIEVTVICISAGNPVLYENIEGARVYRLRLAKKRAHKLRYMFEYFVFFVKVFYTLNFRLGPKTFDAIQVSNLPDFLVFSTIVQKILGKKIVLDMHEIMPEFFMSKYGISESSLIIRLLRSVERSSLKYANELITVTDPIKEIFERRSVPGRTVHVVMNTVDESSLGQINRHENSVFSLVYHGTLTDMYALDLAIEVMHKFSRFYNRFKFHILGEGPALAGLRELVRRCELEDHVVFTGYLPYEETVKHLESMTAGILPMRRDVFLDLSFSNKLAEYIFLKIPVITSNLKSTRYYFGDDELTYFESGNAESLFEKLEFAYNNRDRMKARAEKAYNSYQSIKWSVMARRYGRIIHEVLA